jgi:hypothetical protein
MSKAAEFGRTTRDAMRAAQTVASGRRVGNCAKGRVDLAWAHGADRHRWKADFLATPRSKLLMKPLPALL